MARQTVVSFADMEGNYAKASVRLEQSLRRASFHGDIKVYHDYALIGSPPHKGSPDAVPYAFKANSIKRALYEGTDLLLWCDSPVFATKDIQPVFDHINEHGYLFFDNIGFSLGEFTSDACLEKWGMDREESFTKKIIMACCFGVKVGHPKAEAFLQKYIDAASDGVSYMGDWTNNNFSVSRDVRCRGTRHDQSTASIIIDQMGLEITNAQQTFFAYVDHKKHMPIADSVCLWSQGM